jgi:hypothetical protein
VTSSVSGKRSPAELIVHKGGDGIRTRVDGFAGRCLASRPLHQKVSWTPRADDGTRTRDPHLGKVMRYQLRYVRADGTQGRRQGHDDSRHADSPSTRPRQARMVP